MATPTKSFATSIGELAARIVVVWATVLGCGILTFMFIGGVYLATNPDAPLGESSSQSVYGNDASSNKLLSLRIEGEIEGQAPDLAEDRLAGVVYGYDIKEQLYAAADRDDVKGIILEINSPGGAIYGTQAIVDGVKYYRDHTRKPVYAHVSGLAASGGYWVATSADRIIADVGSSLGSIGVIEGPFKYYDKVLGETTEEGSVITQNGIQSVVISAGKGKGLGDPYQKLTAEEIATLQASVNNDYAEFVGYVSARRKIPTDVINNRLGALIYGTQSAQAAKLIDAQGGREYAYDELAKAANLSLDDYQVERPSLEPTSDATDPFASQVRSFLRGRSATTPTSTRSAMADGQPSWCRVSLARAYYGDPTARCH